MPVVANGGLVGIVTATTPHGATVRLISDVKSLIGVTFGSGNTSIVVSGQGVNNGLGATSVPLTSSVRAGTVLSTNGLDGGLYRRDCRSPKSRRSPSRPARRRTTSRCTR